ncbi:MAG: hypothetical protein C4523_08775 [Myxococcales bacterium]|nr:MAG: hypothetical protein C4523_08775 [Myxococcales bacterium]
MTKTINDLTDYVLNDPIVAPTYSDLADELALYRAEHSRPTATLWTFATKGNRQRGEALFLGNGRVGICTGGDSAWGDYAGEEDMEQAIVDCLSDADAWERRS